MQQCQGELLGKRPALKPGHRTQGGARPPAERNPLPTSLPRTLPHRAPPAAELGARRAPHPCPVCGARRPKHDRGPHLAPRVGSEEEPEPDPSGGSGALPPPPGPENGSDPPGIPGLQHPGPSLPPLDRRFPSPPRSAEPGARGSPPAGHPSRGAGEVCKKHTHNPKNVVTAAGDDSSCSIELLERKVKSGDNCPKQLDGLGSAARMKQGLAHGSLVDLRVFSPLHMLGPVGPGALLREVDPGAQGSSGAIASFFEGVPGRTGGFRKRGCAPLGQERSGPLLPSPRLWFSLCPASVRCPGIRHGADGSPGPSSCIPPSSNGSSDRRRNQISAYPRLWGVGRAGPEHSSTFKPSLF